MVFISRLSHTLLLLRLGWIAARRRRCGGLFTGCAFPPRTWILSAGACGRNFQWDSACMRSFPGFRPLAPLKGPKKMCADYCRNRRRGPLVCCLLRLPNRLWPDLQGMGSHHVRRSLLLLRLCQQLHLGRVLMLLPCLRCVITFFRNMQFTARRL